jgi:hypothetical protein
METQTEALRTTLKPGSTVTQLSKLELESLLNYSKVLYDFGEYAKSEDILLNQVSRFADPQLSTILQIQLGLLNS